MELSLQHNGDVQPCCLLDDYPVGNIKNHTIMELWNSKKMQKIRKEFISGDIKICAEKIAKKGCHQWYHNFRDMIELKVFQEIPVRKLDIRLNGRCNLQCIMCDVWKDKGNHYGEKEFWSYAPLEVFPHLYEIDLLGGEPFIQKDTYRLIDEMSVVNPGCRWNITTNGNWKFNRTIESYLNKVNIVSITLSLDSIFPDTFARIRRKGDFRKVIATLDALNDYCKRREIFFKIDCVVQMENYNEVFNYTEFTRYRKLAHAFIFLTSPEKLSAVNMLENEKIPYLKKLREEFERTKNIELLQIYNPIFLSLSEKQKDETELQYVEF